MPFNASLTLIAQIGEDSNKISAELKKKHSEIDWERVYGLRNRIVHDYAGIDKYITFKIVKDDLPELIEKIIPLIEKELEARNCDMGEFDFTRKSGYYKYIDFSRFRV